MSGWQQIHGGSREEIKGYMEEEIYFRGICRRYNSYRVINGL